MTNKRPDLAQAREKILACLATGPKLPKEIAEALDVDGNRLSNRMRAMLAEGLISRKEITGGRYRYYLGNGSGEAYTPFKARVKSKAKHKIPTKVVTIRPPATEGYSSLSAQITMPAAPWEVRA